MNISKIMAEKDIQYLKRIQNGESKANIAEDLATRDPDLKRIARNNIGNLIAQFPDSHILRSNLLFIKILYRLSLFLNGFIVLYSLLYFREDSTFLCSFLLSTLIILASKYLKGPKRDDLSVYAFLCLVSVSYGVIELNFNDTLYAFELKILTAAYAALLSLYTYALWRLFRMKLTIKWNEEQDRPIF